MIRFRVEVDGITELDRGFNRVDQYVSDFRNIWPNVIKDFYQIEREQFASQGSHGASGKWAPLSPAYAKYKAIKFPGQPILQATDDLRESLTDPNALDAILIPEKFELTIGSKVPYAKAHQTGSKRGLPARPPISLSEGDKRTIQKSIQRGLVEFARAAGFKVEDKAA